MSRNARVGKNGENFAKVWRIFIWGSKGFPLRVAILAKWYIWRIRRTFTKVLAKFQMRWQRGPLKVRIFPKKANMVRIRQSFSNNSNQIAKGSPLKVPKSKKKLKWDSKVALWEWRFWRKRQDRGKWRIWATFAKVLATSQMTWQMIYIGYKEWINSPQNGYYNLWDTNAWYCHYQRRFQNETYIHYIFGDGSPFSSKSPLSKGLFAILFEFLRSRWQMFAIFAIFAKYAIFAKIATLKGPLCYWNFPQPAGDFFFCQIRHFRHCSHFRTFFS